MADEERKMRGSKRRSYLGIGVAKRKNNNLGDNIGVLCSVFDGICRFILDY